jgi:hypothetical protein
VSHAADRRRTLRQRRLCDVDFGHGFWTRGSGLLLGEGRLLQKGRWSQGVVASPPH